jgi:hypothetical protein
VNFQKEGYAKEELLAGLAQVLPKNVWQYVVQIPRMAALGQRFVLQGGTQYNLAAVKAQVDYIKERVPGAEVLVHPHCGEAGAIGAAFEALRVVKRRGHSTFVGLDAAIAMEWEARNDESTRCHFCANNCARTFIDTHTPDGSSARYISGFSCEKGTVESNGGHGGHRHRAQVGDEALPESGRPRGAHAVQALLRCAPLPEDGAPMEDIAVQKTLLGVRRAATTRGFSVRVPRPWNGGASLRIGIPRMLNIWSTAPFWRTYLEALGMPRGNVVFSDNTSEEMWIEGGKYGSVDPCFPAKVGQAHVHNLLFHHHSPERPLNYIFNPSLTHVPSFVKNAQDYTSCPIVAGSPNVLKAAFTKEMDFFAQRGIRYIDSAFTLIEPHLLRRQLFETFAEVLQITEDESDFACTKRSRPCVSSTRTCRPRDERFSTRSSATTGSPCCCSAGRTTSIPGSTTACWKNSSCSASRCSASARFPRTKTTLAASSPRIWPRASSRVRSKSATCGPRTTRRIRP